MKSTKVAVATGAASLALLAAGCSAGAPAATTTTSTGSTTTTSTAAAGNATSAATSAGSSATGAPAKKDLTFVIVPKVVHPWFDEVNKGAKKEADKMKAEGVNVKIDYRAPQNADVAEQNSVLEQAAATKPDGIALDPLDYAGNKAVIEGIQKQGIPVVLFDSPSPEGSGLTSVGTDFAKQATVADQRMAELLGAAGGKVAVMAGVPTAPNHKLRYDTHMKQLATYPNVKPIDGGIDNDSIQTAQTQAASIIAANPDLKGYVCSDAACPIGVGNAVREAGKQGQIKVVGMDNLIDVLKMVKDGTIQATSASLPQADGAKSVEMLYKAVKKEQLPATVDTGIELIDSKNVDEWIKTVGE